MKYTDDKIFYEQGDWVVVSLRGSDNPKINVCQITHTSKTDPFPIYLDYFGHVYGEDIRPATQEEIYKEIKGREETIEVGGYKVKFYPPGDNSENALYIEVGCIEVNKAEFRKIGKKAGWIIA